MPSSEIPFVEIEIERPNKNLNAWLVQKKNAKGVVLLLHPLHSNRTQMLSRAKFLYKAGYTSLLIDLQGHGRNTGEKVTFGYKESHDVDYAMNYLKQRYPEIPIGVLGISLGGASALLSHSYDKIDFLILEAVYNNLRDALNNRIEMKIGRVGKLFTPILIKIFEYQNSLSVSNSPENNIVKYNKPVLIIAGSLDKRTTIKDSEKLFAKANEPKDFWKIDNARHQDFYLLLKEKYENRVLKFLDKELFTAK